jgi:acyl-CoA synthetase (AMP-forming)/AMP-acid ligase II
MIHQLVTSPEWEKANCSSIDTIGSGAAFLPPELRAKFQSKLKSTLYQGYGSTEAVRILLFTSKIQERFTRW